MDTSFDVLNKWDRSLKGNNNSYKFVLAIALLEFSKNTDLEKTNVISYDYLINIFVEFYWNHLNRYKLNHSISHEKKPLLNKIFLDLDIDENLRSSLYSISYRKLKKDHKEVVQQLLSNKKIIISILGNPISRFNFDNKGSDHKAGKGYFYEWNRKKEIIILNKDAFLTIKKENKIFTKIVQLGLASFLEKYNVQPNLIDKSKFNIKRPPFSKFINDLFKEETQLLGRYTCFYCETKLEKYDKDHFIPWEYVLEHKIWNLVAACRECNSEKSTNLPSKKSIKKLEDRNKEIFSNLKFKIHNDFDSLESLISKIDDLHTNASKAGYLPWNKYL
ncbi:HNH endonuclease [Pseudoalteromonas sp. SG45-1]|uniref:HNH endonuclease n=1 Tax=Pseudoalteromonas sp. SG45-1 TaxID=2760957 RepID=UPI0016025E23|nr:HNH endonuclease signature motif containing protein [Pseudoalteromonas sp. SG45-1]MBB1403149.1 HNH endonuclease [Pseudoalteromonas sp. SG45-1]